MIIKAKFKGQNGSLGFYTGVTYLLEFSITPKLDLITIDKPGYGRPIPYSSLRSFLNN